MEVQCILQSILHPVTMQTDANQRLPLQLNVQCTVRDYHGCPAGYTQKLFCLHISGFSIIQTSKNIPLVSCWIGRLCFLVTDKAVPVIAAMRRSLSQRGCQQACGQKRQKPLPLQLNMSSSTSPRGDHHCYHDSAS